MKTALAATAFLILASIAGAQTISPGALEFKGPRAKGTIMVRNDSVGILTVKIQPQGFAFANGQPKLAELPDGFQFKSKQAALTLGPQQQKFVDFDARCPQAQCQFYVTAVFTTPAVKDGLNVALWLPVPTYLCSDKGKGCRKRTLTAAGVLSASK